jgi:hypothetical protein
VNGNLSITFGAAVSDVYPALLDHGYASDLTFGYWSIATDSRWEITEVGSVSGHFCDETGQYDAGFVDDCFTISFTLISDNCEGRTQLLSNDFTLVSRSNNADCVSSGTVLQTQLGDSITAPELSRADATVVFGEDGYATVSIADRGTLYQRWSLHSTNDGETTRIVDIGSTGDDFSCPTSREGVYYSDWDSDCSAQLCGITDSCVSRGELFHATAYNGFQPIDGCVRDVHFPTLVGFGACNPDQDTWEAHPWDCIDQDVPGGCMFCLGRANGNEFRQCLDRNGAVCNEIFNSIAAKAFCTLEFECPASTTTLSITVFISSIVALLLFR